MKENNIINEAGDTLYTKIQFLNLQDLNISEYNRNYLKKYIDNLSFYISQYSQLFVKALKKLNKPVSESSFIDYGGGCGILSFFAKEIGFKTVIYNDINQNSVIDARIISENLGISVDYFISGDVEKFICEMAIRNIKPDLICSFDVLEHIYDIEFWIKTITQIDNDFSILSMTSANSRNPFIVYRLKKLQVKAEYEGVENNLRREDVYSDTSFLEERRRIISNKFPDLNSGDIKMLSINTRGLVKDNIEKVVNDYIKTGEVPSEMKHPTNTCDPYTGSWTEKLIDLKQLKTYIKSKNLIVNISNSFYSYSNNKRLNLLKYLLNQLIKVLGPGILFFSPSFILEIQKSVKIVK